MVTLISPNITRELYNITVTCIIHPDSTADQCVVMVITADGRVTRTGNENINVWCVLCTCSKSMYTYVSIPTKDLTSS